MDEVENVTITTEQPGRADIVLPEELIPTIPATELTALPPEGKLRKALHAAKYTLASTVVAFEVFPITNEGSRYGMLAATETMSSNPLLAAGVLGGSTLIVEGAGAVAASHVLTSETSNRLFNWVNDKMERILPSKTKSSRVMEAGVALYAGAPTVMLLKQRQNPERTKEEARRHGLITTAWVSGVCAVEGAAIAEGVGNYADPKKLAAALVAVGMIRAVPSWAKRRFDKKEDTLSTITEERSLDSPPLKGDENDTVPPRYDLSSEELNELEQGLVNMVKEKNPEEGVAGVWIRPNSKYANFVRVHEASYFPEVEQVSEEDEEHTLFLALVDTRSSSNRVVHAATVTGVSYGNGKEELVDGPDQNDETTGFYTVDSLIELGNFTAADFYDYYGKKGIDLKKSLSVETNFRIGEKAETYHGLRMADLAYLLFFRLLEKRNAKVDAAAVFATVNQPSIKSFDRVGMSYEPLMGRKDLLTEESIEGRDSLPVVLTYDADKQHLFGNLRLPLPELFV